MLQKPAGSGTGDPRMYSCRALVFADTPYYDLIAKILEALRDANCWMEGRLCLPDSEGDEKVKYVSPYIRAVGRHHSGNIWVATHTEAGRDMLVATVD